MSRLTLSFAVAASFITSVLLILSATPLHAQPPTPGSLSPCNVSPPTVQAPPSGVVQTSGGFEFFPTLLSSLDDAQAAYDTIILVPATLPEGFELGRIEYFHSQPPVPQIDQLVICYYDAAGHYLEALQGFPAPEPGGPNYMATPDDHKGMTTVQGQTVYWTEGKLFVTGAQANGGLAFTWEPGSVALAWWTDVTVDSEQGAFIQLPGGQPMPQPPINIGYQLESDALSLDDLIAIATSVQPFGQTATPGP